MQEETKEEVLPVATPFVALSAFLYLNSINHDSPRSITCVCVCVRARALCRVWMLNAGRFFVAVACFAMFTPLSVFF